MELHCLPAATPTASSHGSADQLYDNCLPYSLRSGRECYGESGATGRCLVPTGGLPASPRGPRLGLAPAAAHVPTLPPGAGGSKSGAWPDHSYCSWAQGPGRQGWGAAEVRWRNSSPVGVGLGGGGGVGKGGRQEGDAYQEGEMHSPSLVHSKEHESALSVYDNLHDGATPDHLTTPMETSFLFPDSEEQDCFLFPHGEEEEIQLLHMEAGGASRDSSLWSSCEIILAGSRSSDAPAPEQPTCPEVGAYCSQTGLADQNPAWHPALAEPGPYEMPPYGARVPPPVPLADPSASALRSLLTGLQQQIGRQREEYEARISSLEQRNEELQSQLLGLRANLLQQRRWYQAVQAKIQESERARAAAEARNATIQREMDQFFDTFGELNNEAKKAERIVRSF
ncbi:unnamed protein product [Merluccius merluccius]